MKRQEVLQLFGLTKLPTKVNKAPTGVKCIAKVSRLYNDPDFAIFKDGSCVMDKGFTHMITDVIQYYYDAPKKEVVVSDKLAELQKMAAEAQKKKDLLDGVEGNDGITELDGFDGVQRPTERKPMQDFVKKHELSEGNPYTLSNVDLNLILDKHFA
jgi:hypothetical protein